jgi:outer membrane protein assembly factor BamB
MIFDGNLGAPTIAHSVVYVGSHGGSLYALNGSTGELICRYQIDFSVVSSPTVLDGVGYVGTWDGYVYAIGAQFTY